MNHLKELLVQRHGLLQEAVQQEFGPSFEWLSARLNLDSVLEQIRVHPIYEYIMFDATLVTLPQDIWESRFGSPASSVPEADTWFEYLEADMSGLGLLIPNDSSPEPRMSLFARSGIVWLSLPEFSGSRSVTVGLELSHCGLFGSEACVPYICQGPCQLVEVLEPPGARKCLCIPHKL